MISHEIHTFNNYYVKTQHYGLLQTCSLKFFNNKTLEYRKVIFPRSWCTEATYWAK